MREFKYQPNRPLDSKSWFLKWNNPNNPFGNYHEPLPYPQSRREQGPENDFLAFLWWQFARNPLHNFTHFTIGITPIGQRYEWITPDEEGWVREENQEGKPNCWVKGNKRKCRKYFTIGSFEGYYGWSDRGSFGVAFRKK